MINNELINNTEHTEWDFGNNILYKMCKNNFKHEHIDKVIGKVILIGRAYAAAIERRKNKAEENDSFYLNKVAPKFINSNLDLYLNELKQHKEITEKNILRILEIHFYLMTLIKELTHQNKRSFSSKYLHFHFPNLFFIYDTRAVKAIGLSNTKFQYKYKEQINSIGIDKEYASFFYKCFTLKNSLENKIGQPISNRHFDNILMKIVE